MSYPTANITFRCYEIHADTVKRAAAKANKNVSDYVRDIVLPWAASDLGERLAPLPELRRGRLQAMLEQAAKRAGVTVEQFRNLAAENAAALALGLPTPEEARAPGSHPPAEREVRRDSDFRALTRPGTYSGSQHSHPEVIRRPAVARKDGTRG